MWRASDLLGKDVGEDEAVASDDLAIAHRDGLAKGRGSVDKGVKLAALAAGVHAGWERFEQRPVELTASEVVAETAGIDAGEFGANAAGDHCFGKLAGGNVPEGKDRFESCASELAFAVGANIAEIKVAKGDLVDAFQNSALADAGHDGLVLVVRAGPGQLDLPERKTSAVGLDADEGASDSVHGDAVCRLVEGREQGDEFNVVALA